MDAIGPSAPQAQAPSGILESTSQVPVPTAPKAICHRLSFLKESAMNQEETMNLPIRYVSITTVPKEYTPHPVLPENQEVDMGTLLSAISSAKSQVSALSPYLFVLFETEKGGAFWQYLDMAGELSRIHFTSSGSYVNATKVTFPNGAYMYRINQVFLQRK